MPRQQTRDRINRELGRGKGGLPRAGRGSASVLGLSVFMGVGSYGAMRRNENDCIVKSSAKSSAKKTRRDTMSQEVRSCGTLNLA